MSRDDGADGSDEAYDADGSDEADEADERRKAMDKKPIYRRTLYKYYIDPTADTAISNIMREERSKKRKMEAELRKMLIKDLGSILREAKKRGRETVTLNAVPVKNLELIMSALRCYHH